MLLVTSSLAIASTSAMFGPFVLLPGLAATNTLFMAMHGPRRYRWLVLSIGVLTIAAPYAAQALGIVPASQRFVEDGMLLVPRVAHHPELATTITLLATAIATTLIPAILAGRMRDALKTAETRLFLQEWRLRQLLPSGVRFAPEGPARS
ncbi:MAG: hypothetical protein M5U28_43545 [Sandaracinaceae bacterium]|nr:hypothetical protein [Sandaracinaceae bacterium]